MREQPRRGGSLFDRAGGRKYVSVGERHRFISALQTVPADVRLFCLVLHWSGARISEVLALTPSSIDIEAGVVSIQTLKRRRRGIVRQVPLPPEFLAELDREFELTAAQRDPELAHRRIWNWSRSTAWRRVKSVMAIAGVVGTAAMPKGLRHSFGVKAFQSGVPPHLVQRWLGHASLETTAIYCDVIGPDEQQFAARMWHP